MKKSILSFLIIAITVCIFTAGCGNKEDTRADSSSKVPLRSITDMAGRVVEIPVTVNKAATIGATARMLTYAGCADKIAGLSDLEIKGEPGMPYAYINSESFSKLTPIASGGASSKTYEESLATLRPDIIFTNDANIDTVNTLQQKLNIPIVILAYKGIFSESVYDSLTLTGDIMGTEERCKKLISAMKGWQKELDSRTKDIADSIKPTVYAGAVSFSGGHGIEGTYAKYPPFVAINAKNVTDETGKDGSILLEKEKLVKWNPDIIFLTPGNMNLVNEDYKTNPGYYNSLKAVKEGNIYSQINYNYYGTNIELAIVDAYYAGTVIYPAAFSDLNFEEKAEEIFSEMLGRPYLQVLKDSGNNFGKMSVGK